MKDMVGNKLKVGDRVATDVLSTKVSHLRVGVISAIEDAGAYIRIYYKIKSRWSKKEIARSITRHPEDVVKVAG